MTTLFDDARNSTISYAQTPRPYHTLIANLVRRHAPGQPRVLDVGCGVGNTLTELMRLGVQPACTVADIDPECLRRTEERLPVDRSILLSKPADIYSLQDTFDVVLLSHVLQYEVEPARLVQHLLTLLNDDGHLIIAIPNLVTPTRFLESLRGRSHVEGTYYWDRRSFLRFLTDVVGATVLETHGDFVPLPGANRSELLMRIGKRLASRFPMVTFSIVCVVTP